MSSSIPASAAGGGLESIAISTSGENSQDGSDESTLALFLKLLAKLFANRSIVLDRRARLASSKLEVFLARVRTAS